MVIVGGLIDLVVNGGLGLPGRRRAARPRSRGGAAGRADLHLQQRHRHPGALRPAPAGRRRDRPRAGGPGVRGPGDRALPRGRGGARHRRVGRGAGGRRRRPASRSPSCVAFLLVGRWAHHAIDRIAPRLDREQLLLGALAIALGGAALAAAAGLSEAVGALLAGVLLSGSEVRDQIEQQLLGLRDFAAAIFFFAFGLPGRPGEAPDVAWIWLLLAVPVAVAGKLVGGYLAGRSTGFTSRESVNVGDGAGRPRGVHDHPRQPRGRGRRAGRRVPRAGWSRSPGCSSWRPRSPGWY